MGDEAALLERAVNAALASGARTGDILQPGMKQIATTVMGDTVLKELDKLA
jgi:3-isopropylmalate dehydrogenase